jgi:hypothetical protein
MAAFAKALQNRSPESKEIWTEEEFSKVLRRMTLEDSKEVWTYLRLSLELQRQRKILESGAGVLKASQIDYLKRVIRIFEEEILAYNCREESHIRADIEYLQAQLKDLASTTYPGYGMSFKDNDWDQSNNDEDDQTSFYEKGADRGLKTRITSLYLPILQEELRRSRSGKVELQAAWYQSIIPKVVTASLEFWESRRPPHDRWLEKARC